MSLSPPQQQTAQLLYGLAVQAGLPPNRAREFVAAAYSESGLNPRATNKSSGAAGLFQLLSSGYRTKAQQLGGLYDPRANALAILPNYVGYWKSHPNAAPGEGGRDVEISGMGADFYSKPLGLLGDLGGGAPVPASPGIPPSPPPRPIRRIPQGVLDQINRSLVGAAGGNMVPPTPQAGLSEVQLPAFVPRQPQPRMPAAAGSVHPPSAPPASGAPRAGLAEAFYDPLGQYDNGRFSSKGIGNHSDHVHLSITNPQAMIAAIRQAQSMGLRVGENPYVDGVDPVHVRGSFHYQNFPGKYGGKTLGKAIDVSGNPKAMGAFYRWATSNLR